jgi:FixJ family two-component response regulator
MCISRNNGMNHKAIISLIGIVDDDESVRDALSSLLRSVGYECEPFSSAEAFLEWGRFAATNCILLDIRMPGMSGLDLHLKLLDMNCQAPVIFVTARAEEELGMRALRQGAVGCLGKPFSEEALLETIRLALNGNYGK